MILHKWQENDAPLLIVMGQSNAHGHGTKLTAEESDFKCSHVYGLTRTKNQSYKCQDVVWEPFTMHGMNLGESQDNTCCLGGEFARLWETTIEQGIELPALYIIQISIGSQGIDEKEKDGLNMWWTQRPPILVPGGLGTVNISLYPLAKRILKLAVKNLKNQGKTPVILGLHWNQWETEVFSAGAVLERAETNYLHLLQGFYDALGQRCQTYLYKPISLVYENEPARKQLVTLFQKLENKYSNIKIINAAESPLFQENKENKGIFQNDLVHYTAETQSWFAKYQFEEIFGTNILENNGHH